MPVNLKGRSFLTLKDFTPDEIRYMLNLAADLKAKKRAGIRGNLLAGKNIVLLFEKTSTRTRCAFEVAAYDEGANVTFLDSKSSQMGKKETMVDTAKVLGRFFDGIEYRGYDQKVVEGLAANAGVPVWNGLTDVDHPTQALADILPLMENTKKPLSKCKLVFCGDTRNNVAYCLMYICAKHMKANGQLPSNTVVTTIMSNFGLYKAFDRIGIAYEKTAVGDRYVYENMKANDHMLGGEQSGHIIFRKFAHTGDGLITAIMLMGVLIDTQLPLSVLAAEVKMYPQVLKNVKVDDKDGTLADETVKAAVEKCTAALGDGGRVLLRKSGTEPVLRVMAEAGTTELCEQMVDAIIAAMDTSGHLIEVKK